MLSHADLESIRSIVREELQRLALPGPGSDVSETAAPAATSDEEHSQDAALRASAAAFYRASVADTRASWDEADRADAIYRVGWDEGYMRRARRTLGLSSDATVSVDEMVTAIRRWRRRRRG